MAEDKRRIAKANEYAVRADTWWSLFEKLWEARGLIGLSLTGAAIVASALYKVFGLINQYGWAGWVLAALPSLILAGGILSFFDWLLHLRRVRRIREGTLPAQISGEGPAIADPSDDKLDAIKSSLSEAQKRLTALDSRRSAESVGLSEVRATVEEFRQTVVNFGHRLDHLSTQLVHAHELANNAGEKAKELKRDIGKLGKLINDNLDYTRQQVASIYNALAALSHRERLEELAEKIDEGAMLLSAPTTMEQHLTQDEWEEWEVKQREWRALLLAWSSLAGCYVKDVAERILDVSAEHLKQKGVAKSAQFPDTEAFIAYKEFWNLLKNWQNWRGEVSRAVHQVAFNGTASSRPILSANALRTTNDGKP